MHVSVTGVPPLLAEQSANASPRRVPPGQAEQQRRKVIPTAGPRFGFSSRGPKQRANLISQVNAWRGGESHMMFA